MEDVRTYDPSDPREWIISPTPTSLITDPTTRNHYIAC